MSLEDPGMSLAVLLVLALTLPAFAYLDPGSGSMLAQALAAGFAGLGVLIKFYWVRIKRFFGFGKATVPAADTQDDSGATE